MTHSDGLLQHDEVFGRFIGEFPCHAKAHHDIRANQRPAPIPLFDLLIHVASTKHINDRAVPSGSGDHHSFTGFWFTREKRDLLALIKGFINGIMLNALIGFYHLLAYRWNLPWPAQALTPGRDWTRIVALGGLGGLDPPHSEHLVVTARNRSLPVR